MDHSKEEHDTQRTRHTAPLLDPHPTKIEIQRCGAGVDMVNKGTSYVVASMAIMQKRVVIICHAIAHMRS
jgi:hypothetical protein